jgi:hypothetical protein
MFKLLITTFICVGMLSAAFGQVKSADSTQVPKSYFAAGGIGLSSLGSFSAMLVANAEIKNRILLSANWIGETNVRILDSRAGHDVDVNSFNLLAGKIYKQRHSLISFSTGLGLVKVDERDVGGGVFGKVNPVGRETTVGIPVLVQAYAIGFQAIGVGLNLYGNLNTKQSTAGFQLSVALGRISTRPRR